MSQGSVSSPPRGPAAGGWRLAERKVQAQPAEQSPTGLRGYLFLSYHPSGTACLFMVLRAMGTVSRYVTGKLIH